jgi:O-antigen ligase
MGLFLTLLYILTAYLSPSTIFGPLAPYHLELVMAVILLILSIPSFPKGLFRQPQMLAIGGMLAGVFISLVLTGWFGSAPQGVWAFLPDIFVYVLIVTHFKTKRHLQLVILTLFLASSYVILCGAIALHANDGSSPFLYDQGIGDGIHIYRLRGLSIVGDPNDFAQVLVSLIPCMFFFWDKQKKAKNIFFVLPSVAILIVGMYMTHSRGSVIALVAIIALAARRKIGTIPAAVIAGGTFAISSALSWSGGRQISAEAGSDRMDAWSTGLELIKQHPIFGVGFTRFTDYNSITAHNSIVVCAAELGFFGFFFWVLFLVSNIRAGIGLSRMEEIEDGLQEIRPEPAQAWRRTPRLKEPVKQGVEKIQSLKNRRPHSPMTNGALRSRFQPEITLPEIKRLGGLMVVCLSGFLVAGWFLSRSYVMWLFIFGGMTQSIVQIAEAKGLPSPLPSIGRLAKISFYTSIALLLVVYAILRTRGLMPS